MLQYTNIKLSAIRFVYKLEKSQNNINQTKISYLVVGSA